MSNLEAARRYFEALAAQDFDTAEELLAPYAEIVTPDGTASGAEFISALREWEGLDNLDVEVADRVLTEEDGVIVSRAKRIFRWKESGEVAYEQPAEARLTFHEGKITRATIK